MVGVVKRPSTRSITLFTIREFGQACGTERRETPGVGVSGIRDVGLGDEMKTLGGSVVGGVRGTERGKGLHWRPF